MDEKNMKSLIEMRMGGFIERINYEVPGIIRNILDPNTKATSKRKLTVTFEFSPDDTRQNIGVSCTTKSTLAPTTALTTSLYVADEDTVVEMVPQIPGQTSISGSEQEAPPMLKLINFD